MSLPTTVILQGTVSRLDVREGLAKESGKPYRIVTAVVVGDQTMGAVTLPDEISLAKGQRVTLLCEVSTFRDDDQLRAVEWLDRPAAAPKA